jgi:ACS family tartrate transporter-like MFS transporter
VGELEAIRPAGQAPGTQPEAIQPGDPGSVGRSALRKAAWRLIPLIAAGYGCAYMDRINIGFAALQMNRALHFTAAIYGFGAGLFFLSYAACEVPSNLLLYRFGARRWLSRIMLTWGLIAMAMLFVRTPWQFYLARFCLGLAEAGFFPGIVFYLMQWFPPQERARAVSRFYISLPLSGVVMGAVAGALLNLDGRLHLAGWQWLFLVEGIPPVLLSLVFFLLLPDTPSQAAWLTQAERDWIARSVRAPIHTASEPVHRILVDPRVWQIGLFGCLMLTCSYGYTLILPQLVQSATRLDATRIGWITAGINLLGVPAMLLGAKLSDRAPARRHQHVIPCCLVMAFGFVAAGSSSAAAIAIPALCCVCIGFNAMQGAWLAIIPGVFQGRSAAAAIAAVNTLCILGGFIGPNFMGLLKDLTGNYQRGLALLSLPMLADAGIMLYLGRQSAYGTRPANAPAIADALESPNL